ncbi:hypothetical protein [Hoylesella timonensis]|nr:hypothetical protein [Hoylesella timonensis]
MYQSSHLLYQGVARSKDGLKAQEEYSPGQSPWVKICQQTGALKAQKEEERGEITFFIIAMEGHGTTRKCRENSQKKSFLKKYSLAKFVTFGERWHSLVTIKDYTSLAL